MSTRHRWGDKTQSQKPQLVSNSKDLDMGLQSDGQVTSDGLEKDPGCGDAAGTWGPVMLRSAVGRSTLSVLSGVCGTNHSGMEVLRPLLPVVPGIWTLGHSTQHTPHDGAELSLVLS